MSTPTQTILAGTRYGSVVVTADRTVGGTPVQCRCDCGETFTLRVTQWGTRESCTKCRGTTHVIYEPGMKFNRLTLVEKVGLTASKHAIWTALCYCGATITAVAKDIGTGNTKSCGCLQREKAAALVTTHGLTGTPEHRVWRGMLSRCHNPNDTGHHKYGGRGITVCDRWRASFVNFLTDMGQRPDGKSIDRINNDGNYEPTNCRWATASEQMQNRRTPDQVRRDSQSVAS